MLICPLDRLPAYYNCTNPYPDCVTTSGFVIGDIWIITQCIASCPSSSRLFSATVPAITNAACEAIVGSSWTDYPGDDIWNWLTAWKFPLLQLVAIFARPALGLSTDVFVIVHLLGNPVGTLKNLLLKIVNCQSRAIYWVIFFDKNPTSGRERG